MDILKKQGGNPGLPGFTYTGDWRFQYSAPDWHIYFLSSGVLKFTTPVEIDLFIVGGGEAGTYFGAGGYGGETLTVNGLEIPVGTYNIVIGSGGKPVYRNNSNLSVPSGYESFSATDSDRAGGDSSAFGYTAHGAYSMFGTVGSSYAYYRIKRYGSNAGGYTTGADNTVVPITTESAVSGKTVIYDYATQSTKTYQMSSRACNGAIGTSYAFDDRHYPRYAPGGGGGQYGGETYSSAQYPPCFRNEQVYSAETSGRHQIGFGGDGICGADAGITYLRGSSSTRYRFGSADGAPNTGAGGGGGVGFGDAFPIGGAGGSGIVMIRSVR